LLMFLGGVASLFVVYWLWNRILRDEGHKLRILKYTVAPAFLILGLLYVAPIVTQMGTETPVTPLSGIIRVVSAIGLAALAGWLWREDFETDSNFVIRMVIAFALLGVSLFIISMGWNRMMDASGEEEFLEGLIYTVYYAVGSIPLQLALGLVLAYVLYRNIWGKEFWRIIFFLPYITPAVAAAVVFRIVFSPRETSLANQFIEALGFPTLRWIQDATPITEALFGLELQGFLQGPSVALVSVILLGIWTYVGYNAVIFLAGMGNIPNDLYEAARVDGANEWHLFRHITLPLLSPVTFYLSILGFIGTFKAFNTLFVMRDTQARGTTDTASIVVFLTFRQASDYGLATAQAVLLMLIILAITQFQRSVLEKRVFYG
jgi:ABC-type sugar transport system permease subunit